MNKAQVAKVEAKSTEAEEKRDRKAKEMSKSSAELSQMHEENSGLKKKIKELDLSVVHVLTSDFGAALEQIACEYPDLNLSKFSVYNEVVDGKIVPSA